MEDEKISKQSLSINDLLREIEISNAIMYNIEDVKFWNYVLKNINEPL